MKADKCEANKVSEMLSFDNCITLMISFVKYTKVKGSEKGKQAKEIKISFGCSSRACNLWIGFSLSLLEIR